MDRRTLAYVGGGAALGLGAFWLAHRDDPGTLFEQLVNVGAYVVTRGARLTHTVLNDAGDVDDDPSSLAIAASAVAGRDVSLDELALSRMLASEEATSSAATKIAIAWVAVNEARRRGVTAAALLLADRGPGDGHFGEQRGRYASTRADSYEGDLQIASDVLEGRVADITSGAVHFYRPKLQDQLYAKGKTSKTAADVAAAWGNGYNVDGTDEGIVFFA
jgi:hypothetical protein